MEEKVTFQEIITRMENATDYSELYDAANLIANRGLRIEVEQLIGSCEDDGDDVETAYSVVTTDLLDSMVNEENVLKRGTDKEYLDFQLRELSSIEATTFEELKNELDRIAEDEAIDDDEYDIFMEIVEDREEKCVKYIEDRSKVTNTDYEDELGIEEDNVKSTIEEIIDSVKALLNEGKKIEEDKNLSASEIQKWVLESIETLTTTDYTCCEYKLDDDLSLFCGWSDGYDENDEGMIHSKNNPTWGINVGIKCNHDYMKTDFDYLNAPYDEETGEVWDTSMTLDEGGISESDAQWYIDQYKEIRASLDKGEIVLESKKIEESNSSKLDELKNALNELNGKSLTPSNLKSKITSICENILGNDVKLSWYKYDEEDEYEFSGMLEVDGNTVEIMADYGGETCSVELRDEDGELYEGKKIEEDSNNSKSLYDWLEERNFEPSIDIVDKDYDMMVAFEFDSEEADKDPFDSYMAMLAKQLKVLDDGNDILTVNMTDYVTRNFDLLDAIFDISAEDKEDEISQLVCDVMPNVISGNTTDSVYTELLNNSKVVESKKLTEGAGAGYTVSGELQYDPQIKSFNVVSRENDIMEVDCDIDGILEDVYFESYDYGDKVEEANVHISHVTLDVCNLKDDDGNDKELDEYTLRDALDGLKVSPLIGAGWTHTTFDGDLSCDENKIDCNAYSDIYVTGVDMVMTNSDLIEYIDKAVCGDNIFTQYTVFSEEEDALETFDELDEAIEWAKANNGYKVVSSQFKYDFDENVEDLFVDEVEWTADDLNESKKIEEKTSFDDYKDYCNDLGIDCKKASSLNKYINDFTNNEAKMNGISDVADKVNQLRKELKQGLKESVELERSKVVESQIKDENLFDEVMSFLYGEYIKDGYDLGDDEEIIDDILRYTYLASLVDLPKDEEDMETEEIVQVPAVQELLKRIRQEDDKLRNVETYEGQLELSDRGILGEIDNEKVTSNLEWYWTEADSALEDFAAENGIPEDEITYSGRGAKHILIPATYENASRYQELKNAFQQFQDEFVQKMNNYSEEE